MTDDKKEVLIDNDFLQYFMRNPKRVDGTDLFLKVLYYMNRTPIIHPYVFEHEMFNCIEGKKLVETGAVKVLSYDKFLLDERDENHYVQMFSELYRAVNGERLLLKKCNVFTYRESEANLGEIHSLLTAFFCGFDLFLSNDNGSKEIAENQLSRRRIEVFNVMDIFAILANDNLCKISSKEFAELTKGDHGRKAEIKSVLEIWKRKNV